MSRQSFLTVALTAALAVTLVFALRPLVGANNTNGVSAATPNVVDSSTRSISITGQGQVKVTPDMASIVFSVESSGADLATAQSDNATRTQAVIAKLKALGIADTDLQTSGYNIMPQYDKDQKLTGYRVVNGVRATVRDLSKLGTTIDEAVKAGANRISSLSFDVADKSAAIRKAREGAVADARSKAEQFATLTNATLGNVLTISETTAEPDYRSAVPAAAPAAGGATPIEPGQGAITLTIQITYELK